MSLPSSITTRLQYQHKSLIEIVEGLSDEQIRQQTIPGKWSVFENIVHLATYQHVFVARLALILEGKVPVFERYSADGDPLFTLTCSKSTREVMQDLLSCRRELSDKIQALEESEVEKKGTHPVFGTMTLTMWLNFFLLHEAHHLFTIFKMAATLRSAEAPA